MSEHAYQPKEPRFSASERDLAYLAEEVAPVVESLLKRGRGNDVLEVLGLRGRWLTSMKDSAGKMAFQREPDEPQEESVAQLWDVRSRIALPKIHAGRGVHSLRALGDVVAVLATYLEEASRIHGVLKRSNDRWKVDAKLGRMVKAGTDYLEVMRPLLEEMEADTRKVKAKRPGRKVREAAADPAAMNRLIDEELQRMGKDPVFGLEEGAE